MADSNRDRRPFKPVFKKRFVRKKSITGQSRITSFRNMDLSTRFEKVETAKKYIVIFDKTHHSYYRIRNKDNFTARENQISKTFDIGANGISRGRVVNSATNIDINIRSPLFSLTLGDSQRKLQEINKELAAPFDGPEGESRIHWLKTFFNYPFFEFGTGDIPYNINQSMHPILPLLCLKEGTDECVAILQVDAPRNTGNEIVDNEGELSTRFYEKRHEYGDLYLKLLITIMMLIFPKIKMNGSPLTYWSLTTNDHQQYKSIEDLKFDNVVFEFGDRTIRFNNNKTNEGLAKIWMTGLKQFIWKRSRAELLKPRKSQPIKCPNCSNWRG